MNQCLQQQKKGVYADVYKLMVPDSIKDLGIYKLGAAMYGILDCWLLG